MTAENKDVLIKQAQETEEVVELLKARHKDLGELSSKLSMINLSLIATCHTLYGLNTVGFFKGLK